MTKHDILTEEEFLKHSPNRRTVNYIEDYRQKNGLKKEGINILDWGCGRGRDVLWLREQGYNAYGIDIDNEPINNGIKLFTTKGYDHSTLRLLSSEGKTDFPNGYFHFTFSDQTFEHVRDIEMVAAEIGRITMDGGMGLHVYPAHKYIVEGHLYMPFIHWLPKNILRKYLIAIYVKLGKEPHWVEVNDRKFNEKVNAYYQYSINKTFYRKYSDVKQVFQNNGFYVSFETINNPMRNESLGRFSKYILSEHMKNYLFLNFTEIELLIKKH
jgi:ubiquinone/menaquinone biosynthesis C-methylase UbiE